GWRAESRGRRVRLRRLVPFLGFRRMAILVKHPLMHDLEFLTQLVILGLQFIKPLIALRDFLAKTFDFVEVLIGLLRGSVTNADHYRQRSAAEMRASILVRTLIGVVGIVTEPRNKPINTSTKSNVFARKS